MTTPIFFEGDGDLAVLTGKTVAIVGYGNQGRAQALNMRDSGISVVVGNRSDAHKKRAEQDGLAAMSIPDAVKQADVVFLLLPDEVMGDVFRAEVQPSLREGGAVVFASGYNLAFDLLVPPATADVLLLAPRMIGAGVRATYLSGEGFFSFIHVHQDASGHARPLLLALAKAIGTLQKGAIEVTARQEAVLDLFNEQAFGPAFGRVLLTAIYTLVDAGYPPEAALVEMFMSGEMSYTYRAMARYGLVRQVSFHSHTSQYGAMSRGVRFRSLPVKGPFREILQHIESGGFAKEWEHATSRLKFKFLKFFATQTRISRLERAVRKNLRLQESLEEADDTPSKEEWEQAKAIEEQLKAFEEGFGEF